MSSVQIENFNNAFGRSFYKNHKRIYVTGKQAIIINGIELLISSGDDVVRLGIDPAK